MELIRQRWPNVNLNPNRSKIDIFTKSFFILILIFGNDYYIHALRVGTKDFVPQQVWESSEIQPENEPHFELQGTEDSSKFHIDDFLFLNDMNFNKSSYSSRKSRSKIRLAKKKQTQERYRHLQQRRKVVKRRMKNRIQQPSQTPTKNLFNPVQLNIPQPAIEDSSKHHLQDQDLFKTSFAKNNSFQFSPEEFKQKQWSSNQLTRNKDFSNEIRDKESRFLSLFTLVRFQNDMCTTSNNHNGTCYTKDECEGKGGLPQGDCASGFGVCCYFENMCSSSTSENGTYFKNPATPVPMCNLMVHRMNDDICQIKLIMDVFEISGPNVHGVCENEFFLVTGGSSVPPICGLNTGQHLIYSVTPDSGPTQLSVILSIPKSASSNARLWNIRIYQYECSSPMLAPVGCLQYYTTASGMVKSFNYKQEIKDSMKGGTATSDGVNHLSGLDYSACIRMESGYCGIRWSQYPGDSVSFTMSGDASAMTATTTLTASNVAFGDTACVYDFVRIPGGSEDGSTRTSRDRYCGTALGFCKVATGRTVECAAALGNVISYSKPFILGVVTDSHEGVPAAAPVPGPTPTAPVTPTTPPKDLHNRGFNLVYNQMPCMT